MFTSPAYSAVHSNNLQSRYPEGWCRLKMSNVLPAAWMRKCNADNSVSVWCCQARHQLLHTLPSTARKYRNSWERLVKGGIWKWPEVMSGLPASNLLFLGRWRGMMKHAGEYWSRWSNNTTSVRPNPARSTCAPTSSSQGQWSLVFFIATCGLEMLDDSPRNSVNVSTSSHCTLPDRSSNCGIQIRAATNDCFCKKMINYVNVLFCL